MKKTLAILLLAICGLNSHAKAEKIPMDEDIRYGKLDNGMTYYIRHNEEPKERASFYIAQNVGAILEEDNQNGLAHFLEHMAFNGTKHFEGKGVLNFLEKHGVSFGRNINAYTMTDETVYNLSNVPANNEGLLDSCLLVLNDWSNYLLLTDEEIEAERGVIAEEWRTRRNAQFRIRSKQNKAVYYNSKYAKRDVIGDLDVIKTFEPKTLRDFYHKWYRTDLQAIIIVGDVDVDLMESKVKDLFSQIPAVENPAPRSYYTVPDNEEPLYALATDKEASNHYISLMFKFDVDEDKSSNQYLIDGYKNVLFSDVLNTRLNERMQQPNCPFAFAYGIIGDFKGEQKRANLFAAYKKEDWKAGLKEVLMIFENIRDYGVTEQELERAKISLLSRFENAYKMKDKISNDDYAQEYVTNYIDQEPIPGIKYEFELLQTSLKNIKASDVNVLAQNFLTDKNMVIVVSGPEEDGAVYPEKEEIVALIEEVKNAKLEQFKDIFVDKPLIAEDIVPGKILERKAIEKAELKATELTLSNGIRVLYRYSDLEKETISYQAHSWGGRSLLNEDQLPNSFVMTTFMSSYGLGDFSAIELDKKLKGKIVSSRFSLGNLTERFSGHASPKDLESMFQLLYLQFSKPRFDKQAFTALHKRYTTFLENAANDVGQAFSDSISVTMANHHSRKMPFTKETFKKVDFDGVKEIFYDRFSNPADFVFTFSGNFETEILETYIEKYIASLKTNTTFEEYADNGVRPPAENVNNHFKRALETPKATVYVNFHKEYKKSREKDIYAYVISQLLSKRYLEEIREKEGGTYGVAVGINSIEHPYEEFRLALKFDCDPEKADKLKGIALEEIQKLIDGKIIEKDLEEIKKNILKVQMESQEKLGYWSSKLQNYAIDGDAGMSNYDFIRFINSIDSKAVLKMAKKLMKNAVKVEVLMKPE